MTTTQCHFGMNVAGTRTVNPGSHGTAGKAPLGAGFEASRAAVDSAVTAAQAKGTSDASAEIDTWDTANTAMDLGINSKDFNVILDTTKITTVAQVRALLAQALFFYQGILTGP